MSKKVSKQKINKKITKDDNLAEVIFKYPQLEEILLDYGMHCAGCIASGFDTIEMGAQVHGMSSDEIDELVERLNEVVEYEE